MGLIKLEDVVITFGGYGGFEIYDVKYQKHHKNKTYVVGHCSSLYEAAAICIDLMLDADWRNKYYMLDMFDQIFKIEGMTNNLVTEVFSDRLKMYYENK